MEEVHKEREEDKLHQFLLGLDDTVFRNVKSSLLSRDPLPSLDEAYHVVTQDEELKIASRIFEDRTDGVSFAVQTSARSCPPPTGQTNAQNPTHVCASCGQSGHLVETCFQTLGYPSWWGDRPRSKVRGGSSSLNSSSSASGLVDSRGVSSVCSGGRMTETAWANQVHTSVLPPASSYSTTSPITQADRLGFGGLDDHQWQTLVQILNERKQPPEDERLSGKFFYESWIIDMIESYDFLEDICDMAPIYIKLPDGRFTVSTKQGKVCLGSALSLQDVYFVDGLECHLISVSQLNRDRGCMFQITDRLCVIQDLITKMLIGAGELDNGLYFFRSVASAASIQSSGQQPCDVWHRRLGHRVPRQWSC